LPKTYSEELESFGSTAFEAENLTYLKAIHSETISIIYEYATKSKNLSLKIKNPLSIGIDRINISHLSG